MSLKEIMGVIEERPGNCETHGEYTAYLFRDRWTDCPICAKRRVDAEQAQEIERQRAERQQAMAGAMLLASGLPRRLMDASISNYEAPTGSKQAEVKANVLAYARNAAQRVVDGQGLILMGKVGTGKTHLACALIRAFTVHHRLTAKYTTAQALFMRVRESYSRDDETEAGIVREMVSPKLLVLDEIGVGKGSEHDQAVLTAVLGQRYDECRPTVLCTNLDAASLRAWLGDRITDRMRETNAVLTFDWASHRGGDV